MPTKKRGSVTKAAMNGTVTVTVCRRVFHPLYRKRYLRSKKFLVDPAGHDVSVGDEVEIQECRPLSKRKRFKIEAILKKAQQLSAIQEEEALQEVTEGTNGAEVTKEEKNMSVLSSTSVPSSSS